MIPTLLWQCPICHTDDALQQKAHWFKPDLLRCQSCGVVWEVRRIIGNDYMLKVISGDSSLVEQERPLAEWYDLMKAGLQLKPHTFADVALTNGEQLYVRGRRVKLVIQRDNPLFRNWNDPEAPESGEGGKIIPYVKTFGWGHLFLTNQRLIWQGRSKTISFWLKKVSSAYTEIDLFFSILYGMRTYRFWFKGESVLKWLTYVALVAKQIEAAHRHKISLSNY